MLSIGASAAATNAKNFPDLQQLTFQNIGQLFLTASEAISKYGGAKIGQKTVIDMLEPLGRYLVSASEESDSITNSDLLNEAELKLEQTKLMMPLAGRAAYTGRVDNSYDPGCFVINEVLKVIFS